MVSLLNSDIEPLKDQLSWRDQYSEARLRSAGISRLVGRLIPAVPTKRAHAQMPYLFERLLKQRFTFFGKTNVFEKKYKLDQMCL